jgi:hypothetical protein
MKTTARIGDSFLSIRESENEAFRAMPGWSNEQGTTMSNSVTLEQLNAPTDQELESLRCAGSISNVWVSWDYGNGMGLSSGVVTAEFLDQWLRDFYDNQISPSEAIHEDEELMLRIPLDEGV